MTTITSYFSGYCITEAREMGRLKLPHDGTARWLMRSSSRCQMPVLPSAVVVAPQKILSLQLDEIDPKARAEATTRIFVCVTPDPCKRVTPYKWQMMLYQPSYNIKLALNVKAQ